MDFTYTIQSWTQSTVCIVLPMKQGRYCINFRFRTVEFIVFRQRQFRHNYMNIWWMWNVICWQIRVRDLFIPLIANATTDCVGFKSSPAFPLPARCHVDRVKFSIYTNHKIVVTSECNMEVLSLFQAPTFRMQTQLPPVFHTGKKENYSPQSQSQHNKRNSYDFWHCRIAVA